MFANCKCKNSAIFTVIIICLAPIFLIVPSMAAAGSDFGQKPWIQVETKHTIIRYKSDRDLLKFHKSVDYGPSLWNRTSYFSIIQV